MFCANCGKWNVEGSRFCDGCGSQLYDNQPPVDLAQQAKAEEGSIGAFFKRAPVKIFLFLMLGVVILLGINGIVKSINGPKRAVRQYMQAYKSANWGKVYGMLDLPADPMLSKEAFISYMTGYDPNIKSFEIADEQVDTKIPIMVSDPDVFKAMTSKSMSYEVKFTEKDQMEGDAGYNYMYVRVVKPEKDKLLGGKKYMIAGDAYVGSLSVEAPMGSQVYLDGSILTSTRTEYGTDYYEGLRVFRGSHSIRIVSDFFETVEDVVNVGDDTYYRPRDLQMSESLKNELLTLTKNMMNSFWTGVFAGSDLQSLKLPMTEDALYNVESAYNYNRNWADMTDGSGMTNCSFKDLKLDSFSFYTYDGEMTVEAQCSLTYSYTESYNGQNYNYDTSPSGWIDFVYTNNGWVVSYIYSYLFNY